MVPKPESAHLEVLPPTPKSRNNPQHGVKGAYYGGDWVDIEDCAGTYQPSSEKCSGCPHNTKQKPCPRSKSRNDASKSSDKTTYDICVIGAGCIGSSIARELSKYNRSVLLLEAADDVSQGATKGNSGIVHAGYDDKPGTNRAKFCWKGNQMFRALDKELRFGYQVNGSLVLATSEKEVEVLKDLMKRGDINGVQNLRLLNKQELFEMEPAVNPNCVAALFSPDAGNVIPYEYAIALAENAVDNGVELRIRREVTGIQKMDKGGYSVDIRHWEPQPYAQKMKKQLDKSGSKQTLFGFLNLTSYIMIIMGIYMMHDESLDETTRQQATYVTAFLACVATTYSSNTIKALFSKKPSSNISELAKEASDPVGTGGGKVEVTDMFTGGSGSWNAVNGVTVGTEKITASYVINCAGGASDKIAELIGDNSFKIKPRLGDYILLNRNQVSFH